MKVMKLVVLSLAVTALIFACKQTETVKEQIQAPAYEEGQEKQQAPSYGAEQKEQTPSYGTGQEKEEAPSYGGMSGDVATGKDLFSNPAFGSSTNDKSCNTCHLNGRGLEKSGEKKEFNIMGMKQNSLEEAVNICIVNPLKGKVIDPKSKDMIDIVTYIKSLKVD